jgi:hypothetical protein
MSQGAATSRILAVSIALLCASSVVVFLVGCDGATFVRGVVRDSEGKPIPEANVKLTTGATTHEVRSTDDGEFEVGGTHAPFKVELTLSATKTGYKPFEKRISSSDGIHQTINIALEPSSDSSSSPKKRPGS